MERNQTANATALQTQDGTNWSAEQGSIHDSREGSEGGAILQATPLGRATFASSLSPEQALVVYRDLCEARRGLVLTDELHLLHVLTPGACPAFPG